MERYAIAGIKSHGRDKPARNNSVSWGDFWSGPVAASAHLRNRKHK